MTDLHDVAKVWGVNFGTFGVVTLTEIEQALKFILLVASLAYTIMKIISWIREEKRKRKNHQ